MTMQEFAPLMFGGLIAIMLIGFPVAFSLAALGLGSGYFAVYMGWFPQSFMTALPLNVFGILSNDLLLAIPFFTLMGTIWSAVGSPKTCSTRWGRCLVLPREASVILSSSLASSWGLLPAPSPVR